MPTLLGYRLHLLQTLNLHGKFKEGKSEDIQLSIKPENLEELAIPQAAFKDIVPLMDFGESLHKDARDFFRSLEVNYKERAVDEN